MVSLIVEKKKSSGTSLSLPKYRLCGTVYIYICVLFFLKSFCFGTRSYWKLIKTHWWDLNRYCRPKWEYAIYSYADSCRKNHNDTIIKTREDFYKKKYTSHFIARFACERELGTEQRLQHIDLTSPSRHSRIFVAASHQTRLDTRSKARRPIKVGIKGRGCRERIETRTLLVSAAHRLT